ncbi:hypothetical protein [Bacillus sp. mrc49]|uniref:hypothetical protein n=1 Tax=Bacillus sp. mrc49 TaxID=2054913 RepID=UPI000C275B98|nr:hypothetical protein [Bacillus sp. mrc49]PJN89058.1 hypothetical protein CVN76_19130 [Bacillus sp. mrc49]
MKEECMNGDKNSGPKEARFRLITGTFTDMETAEMMADELKHRYGWIVYIIPEQRGTEGGLE